MCCGSSRCVRPLSWPGNISGLRPGSNTPSPMHCLLLSWILLNCKCILQLGQIHLSIWTNTVCNLDKYIVQFGEIQRVYCSRAPPLTKDEHGPQCSGLLGRLCYSPEWILQGFVGVFVFSYFVVFVFSYFVVFLFCVLLFCCFCFFTILLFSCFPI